MTNCSKPVLPNFMLVGAAKSGTSSLYYYLKGHPEIHFSRIKEPCFISAQFLNLPQDGIKDTRKYFVRTYEEYCSLFENTGNKKAIGEASADNLSYYNRTIPLIKKYLGNPKIMAILRNPVTRAYSAYLYQVRDNRELLSFEDALKEEETRIKNNWQAMWHYCTRGLYYNQVKAFMDEFSHVKILLYDDLKKDPLGVVKEVCEFLEIDSNYRPSDAGTRYNTSGIPRFKRINKLFLMNNFAQRTARKLGHLLMKEQGWIRFRDTMREKIMYKPEMKPETREYLVNYFREDILKLQDLLDRDLSAWLNTEKK